MYNNVYGVFLSFIIPALYRAWCGFTPGMMVISCGEDRMIAVRKGLVFVVLLITALVLAAPVSAAHAHPAPGSFNLTTAPGPSASPSGPHAMDAATRAAFDAAAAGDMSALAPAPTAFDSIGPGDSLQAAIDAAPDGSTLYLDPGIYYEHDLVVNKDLFIQANETLGGTPANTIIDARGEGRIFTVGSNQLLYLDNLTLRNGFVSGNGGAISTTEGDILIVSSVITNCSATGYGGAVYSYDGITVIGWSAISRCTVTGPTDYSAGGAVYSDHGVVGIISSSFSDCSAPNGWGGAIESDSRLLVISSTFTRCFALDGGALDFYDEGATVYGSTFTDCTATRDGGALWYLDGGGLEMVASTFTRCSAAEDGGAIAADGDTLLESVTFTGCSAGADGGAIYSWSGDLSYTSVTFTGCTATGYGGAIFISDGGTADVTSSSFTGCSAASGGGAIAVLPAVLTITSSSFERCSAGSDGGGAILSFATTSVHFSGFYQNTATGSGTAIRFVSGTIDANNNWWGTNSGPGTSFHGPAAAVASWLVLGITADPSSVTVPQTSYIRTNLTYNSDGTNTAGGGIYLPDAIPNAYAVVSGPGNVAPASAGSVSGGAQTTFITLQPGTTTIGGTVDGQTVYITLNVAQGTWTPAPTEVPNDDDWPQVGGGASGGGGGGAGGSAATTGSSAFPLMTVTVNIGGDSKAWQAIVTGTKLSDLIVTGTVQHGAGDNVTAPPGIVYQYISLAPARYDTITNAVINFTIPQSWLDENHIAPGSIVLYRLTPNGWEALPATVLYTKDGTVYFSAVSPGFSLFAIAGTPTVLTPPVAAPILEIVSTPVQELTPAPAPSVKAPVPTQTTAPPAPTPQPAAPSPFLNIVLIIAAIGILAGGGFIVRRWWIRRQNPALFAEYE